MRTRLFFRRQYEISYIKKKDDKMNRKIYIFTILTVLAATHVVWAHAHVHIGRNMDQTTGTADDNQLFLFGMPTSMQPENYWPNFPQWGEASSPYDMTAEPLKLVYQDSGLLAGKYLCEYMACFHSAHPPHGNWQLGGTDESISPDWSIGIERVSASAEMQFLDEDTLGSLLINDGDQVVFPTLWFDDKANENGELGAWGLHHHVLFVVDGAGVNIGDTFYATLSAFDDNGIFSDSEAYTLRFEAVPEPATLLLTALGSLSLLRKRRIK